MCLCTSDTAKTSFTLGSLLANIFSEYLNFELWPMAYGADLLMSRALVCWRMHFKLFSLVWYHPCPRCGKVTLDKSFSLSSWSLISWRNAFFALVHLTLDIPWLSVQKCSCPRGQSFFFFFSGIGDLGGVDIWKCFLWIIPWFWLVCFTHVCFSHWTTELRSYL